MKLLVFAAILAVATGCSREAKTFDVSGTVTWEDGTPLQAGLVFFDPAPGTDGPQGSATIRAGSYATADGGKKVAAGAYNVRIEGYGGKGGAESPMGRLLFRDFEQQVDLPASNSVQNFQVPNAKKQKD